MHHPGWILIVMGVLLAAIGAAWLCGLSFPWLGRLPGDMVVERRNFRLYIPITTCAVISLVLTGIAWLFRYFVR